jgi:hypothetical protein
MLRCFKYRRIINKIRNQLPKYAPESGARLYWGIGLGYYREYNTVTGEPIRESFVPRITIIQKCPDIMVDNTVYGFNWKKKELIRTGLKWRY